MKTSQINFVLPSSTTFESAPQQVAPVQANALSGKSKNAGKLRASQHAMENNEALEKETRTAKFSGATREKETVVGSKDFRIQMEMLFPTPFANQKRRFINCTDDQVTIQPDGTWALKSAVGEDWEIGYNRFEDDKGKKVPYFFFLPL